MNSNKTSLLMAFGIVVAALLGACNFSGTSLRVGEMQRESRSVEMQNVDQVEVRIEMAVGDLTIGGGAGDFMEADFAYNVAALKPEIEERNERLSIITPDTNFRFSSLFDLDDFRNEWDLRFNDDVRISMDIDLGVGRAEIDLGSLNIERLDIDSGVGELNLELSGSNLERLRLDAGVGDVRIDMSGDWAQDVMVNIHAGVGEITIVLPNEVGVIVDVDGGITDINAEGLAQRAGRYENEAYGSSDAVIEIFIDAGVGEVNLVIGK